MHFLSNELTIKGTTKIRFHRQRQLYIRSAQDEPTRLRIPHSAECTHFLHFYSTNKNCSFFSRIKLQRQEQTYLMKKQRTLAIEAKKEQVHICLSFCSI